MSANDISISELRQHLAEYLTRVKRGETLRVTQRGRVVARIEPTQSGEMVAKDEAQARQLRAFVAGLPRADHSRVACYKRQGQA